MKGDLFDAKAAIAAILTSAAFMSNVALIVADKGDGLSPTIPSASGLPTVLPYERLTKQVPLPLCELLGYQTTYTPDTAVKEARHKIGARWSTVEATEELATRSIEVLMSATVYTLWGDDDTRGSLLADVTVNAGPVAILEEDYAQLLPATPAANAFLKSATLIFELTTWRD
jgi:hypothetical protein